MEDGRLREYSTNVVYVWIFGVGSLIGVCVLLYMYLLNQFGNIVENQAVIRRVLYITFGQIIFWGTIGTTVLSYCIAFFTRRLTERLLKEEQEKRLIQIHETQKNIVQSIAHNLRTPITSVRGYIDLIKIGAVEYGSEEFNQFIDTIEKSAFKIEKMTDELLEKAKPFVQDKKLNLSIVEINEVIEEIESEINPILLKKGQKLKIITEKDLVIVADRLQIIHALTNLLTNASKFSKEGDSIELHVEKIEDNLQICVRDYGIGLRKEDLPKLFSPYPEIQVDGDYDRTGLGLSIVNNIVTLHGGEIKAESDGLGKGTMFWVRIPVIQTQ